MLPIKFTLPDGESTTTLSKFKNREYESQLCSVCNREYYNNIFYKDEDGTYFKCLNCLFVTTTQKPSKQITEYTDNFKGKIMDFIINSNNPEEGVFYTSYR
jgi:uncharacterized cysteine cluster protein YcgN (CxxCxxCC family)